MFDVPILSDDKENFPVVSHEPLDKVEKNMLNWLTPSSINLYFDERKGLKGHEKGRKLFMCEFVKSIYQFVKGDDVFIVGKCSAEQKKSTDYEIKVHLNCKERNIVKASCGCPAGIGPNAACKHVSALLYCVEHYGVTGI